MVHLAYNSNATLVCILSCITLFLLLFLVKIECRLGDELVLVNVVVVVILSQSVVPLSRIKW